MRAMLAERPAGGGSLHLASDTRMPTQRTRDDHHRPPEPAQARYIREEHRLVSDVDPTVGPVADVRHDQYVTSPHVSPIGRHPT